MICFPTKTERTKPTQYNKSEIGRLIKRKTPAKKKQLTSKRNPIPSINFPLSILNPTRLIL